MKYTERQILEAIAYWEKLLVESESEFKLPGLHKMSMRFNSGALRCLSAAEARKMTGLDMFEFEFNTPNRKKSKTCIVRIEDRAIVLVKSGENMLPFYTSTGQGGKDRVQTGKWYMFFGVPAKPGSFIPWLNKGSQDQILACYGIPEAKKIKTVLDARLDLTKQSGRQLVDLHCDAIPDVFIPRLSDCTNGDEINRIMEYRPYKTDEEASADGLRRIDAAIRRLHGAPGENPAAAKTPAPGKVTEIPASEFKPGMIFGRESRLLKDLDGANYMNRIWFSVAKSGAFHTAIIGDNVRNMTFVNGKPTEGTFIIKPGTEVCLGSRDLSKTVRVCRFKIT